MAADHMSDNNIIYQYTWHAQFSLPKTKFRDVT